MNKELAPRMPNTNGAVLVQILVRFTETDEGKDVISTVDRYPILWWQLNEDGLPDMPVCFGSPELHDMDPAEAKDTAPSYVGRFNLIETPHNGNAIYQLLCGEPVYDFPTFMRWGEARARKRLFELLKEEAQLKLKVAGAV